MPRHLWTLRPLALLVIAGLGCGRCGAPTVAPVADPAELAPANAQGAVLVPQLLRLGQNAQRLSQLKIFGLLASLVGAGNDGSAFLAGFKQTLGFDPTSAEGIRAVGIEPAGPLLSLATLSNTALTVVAVADDKQLDGWITKLAKDRLRATTRAEHDGLTSLAPNHGLPAVAWARRGKYAVIAVGAGCDTLVAAALKQDPAHSLAGRSEYFAFSAAHRDSDVVVWAPPEGTKPLGISGGLKLAAVLEAHRARATLDLPLDTAQATALVSLQGEAGSDLVAQLDPEAFLVARTGLDPATLWPLLETLTPPQLGRQLLGAGIRPAAVLANLKPGAAMSLSLPGKMDLGRMPSFDPRESNPFRYLYLAVLGRMKDPAATKATLEDLEKFGGRLGLQLAEHDAGTVPVYTFSYALGEGAAVALDGERLAVTGGENRLPPLLARAAGAGFKVPAEIAPRFGKAGLAVWLDIPRIVSALRAQPDSAFGLGGFAIKAALMRWLLAIDELKGALLLADAKPDATGTTLHVELQADLP